MVKRVNDVHKTNKGNVSLGKPRKKPCGLLRLPIVLRLEIYHHLFGDKCHQICPHNKLPLLSLTTYLKEDTRCQPARHSRKQKVVPKLRSNHQNTALSILCVNRQINIEATKFCVVYLEKVFTYPLRRYLDSQRVDVEEILGNYSPNIWQFISRIGFSIDDAPDEDSGIERFERLGSGLRWVS